MLRKSKNTIKALAICTGFFSLAACKEYSVSTGEMVPEIDNINTFGLDKSSFDINIENKLSDSVLTSNFIYASGGASAMNAIIVGTYTDPFYGKTTANAHFQLAPYSSSFKFPEDAAIDSAVLVLPFKVGTNTGLQYGDTTTVLKWNVYKTGEKLTKANNYYSTKTSPVDELIGTASFSYSQFNQNSMQIIGATSDTTYGQIRIKLSQDFAAEMFNADSSVYKNTTAFQNFFNGISIVPDDGHIQNSLVYLLLPSPSMSEAKNLSAARVEFHYHTADTTTFQSLVMRPSVCAYYSSVSTDRSGYPVADMFNRNTDSILIQAQPGLVSDIIIKNLKSIPQSVINKAEIVFTVQKAGSAPNYLDYLSALDVVVPVIVTDNGKEEPLYERLDNNNTNYTSGIYMVNPYAGGVTIDGIDYVQYKINIPRTVQQYVLEGRDEMRLRLKGPNNFPGMFRILAKGANSADNQMNLKFNIIYTKK
jgi:hypothetical protein